MDDFDEKIRTADRLAIIAQHIGFTLWQIQSLEDVTAHYFVLVAQATKGLGSTAGNALVEKALAKPFGGTITQICKAGLLTPEIEIRFKNLLAERNWLVHKSRASNRNAIHSDTVANKLIERIDQIAEEANALGTLISGLTMNFADQHDISAEYVEELTEQLLKRWHSSET